MHLLKNLYKGCGRAKCVFCALCGLVYLYFISWAGGSLSELGLVLAAVLCSILLPGLLAVRLLGLAKPDARLAAPLAILFGTGFFAVLYCFSMRFSALWLLRALPLLLSAVYLALWWKDGRKVPALCRKAWYTPARTALALLVFGLIFFGAFAAVIKYARPSHAGDVLLDQDMLWLVGNAKSFQIAFPPQDMRFYNVRFSYHYLTELLCAALGLVTGIDCYNILAFYMQPFMLVGLVVCLARMGQLFYGKNTRKSLLFPFSLFCFACASLWAILPNGRSLFGNSNITHLLTNITSQTTAVMYLAIFCALFFSAAQADFRISWRMLATLLCSFVMLTVAKGPLAIIVGVSACITILLMLARRKAGLKALLLLAVGAGVFAALYAALFSAGANGSMRLSLVGTLEHNALGGLVKALGVKSVMLQYLLAPVFWVLQVLLMAPAAFFLYMRGLWGDVRGFFNMSAQRLFANGCAGGGLLAFFLFSHPHYSQVYFFLLALVFMNLLAVDGLDSVLARAAGWRARVWQFLVRAGACAGLATALFLFVYFGGSGTRYFLRDIGVLDKYPYDTVMTADDEAAALWLSANTDARTAMFATNRIHSDNNHFDGISNIYTAFSGRQGFMEGYTYVADSAPWMWVDERKADNATLFDAATDAATLRAICQKHGITHLVYSRQLPGSESQLAAAFPCVYSGPDVRIYAVQ